MRTGKVAAAAAAAVCALAGVAGTVWALAAPGETMTSTGAAAAARALEASHTAVSRIAFGSCLKQDNPQPIWDAVLDAVPDLFIFLGDNVYADTSDIDRLKDCYERLSRREGFRRLLDACTVLATWDDHDYYKNGSAGNYRGKRESQQVFMDFWGDPADSARRTRDGVYDAYVFGPEGRRVQVILLDARFFKDKRRGTILGDEQWAWFEEQLKVPADVRIVANGTQVIARDHGGEKWADIPGEIEHLIEVIGRAKADGVILLSGDRHHAEISRLTPSGAQRSGATPIETGTPWDPHGAPSAAATGEREPLRYPLYDVTASSLNRSKWFVMERNPSRVGRAYPGSNFGFIEIDWSQKDPVISMQVRDVAGRVRIREDVRLSELRGREGAEVAGASRE
jgi:alkaline phosphatase D